MKCELGAEDKKETVVHYHYKYLVKMNASQCSCCREYINHKYKSVYFSTF